MAQGALPLPVRGPQAEEGGIRLDFAGVFLGQTHMPRIDD